MGIAEIVGLVLFGVVLVLVVLAWRRVRLVRAGGVEVAYRPRPELAASRWCLCVGRYRGDEFVCYHATGLLARPNHVLNRVGLSVIARRKPGGAEVYAMPAGATVLRCRTADDEFEVAMDVDALTGFLSWLESSPPGHAVLWAS